VESTWKNIEEVFSNSTFTESRSTLLCLLAANRANKRARVDTDAEKDPGDGGSVEGSCVWCVCGGELHLCMVGVWRGAACGVLVWR
jgi:hypothetical protein